MARPTRVLLYRCLDCGEDVVGKPGGMNRCLNCGGRNLFKKYY